ncbi:MAG: NYN domain-containing protein [Candidatus Krumholzibacteriia bacterium]
MKRVVAYVDGFNLYHSLLDLHVDHYKWLDLRRLLRNFAPASDNALPHIFYFTAYAYWRKDSMARHKEYVAALADSGVTPIIGRFKEKDRECLSCGYKWIHHEEKESDVAIGVSLMSGALKNQFDKALLLTRDSDLVPAVRQVKKLAPEKEIVILTPDWDKKPFELVKAAGGRGQHRAIKQIHIERSLLPYKVFDAGGTLIATRPTEYDPPSRSP